MTDNCPDIDLWTVKFTVNNVIHKLRPLIDFTKLFFKLCATHGDIRTRTSRSRFEKIVLPIAILKALRISLWLKKIEKIIGQFLYRLYKLGWVIENWISILNDFHITTFIISRVSGYKNVELKVLSRFNVLNTPKWSPNHHKNYARYINRHCVDNSNVDNFLSTSLVILSLEIKTWNFRLLLF